MDLVRLRAEVERWIAGDFDPVTRRELADLLANEDLDATDLAERFAGDLEFGTAGLRGLIGAGPNRMNRAVVARATWALGRVLAEAVPDASTRGIVVGGDARRMSPQLVADVAAILGAAGFRVVRFAEPVPTPLVGFAVASARAAAGVMITASHNAAEYNGYKVFWENGAQLSGPADVAVTRAIAGAPPAREIPRPDLAALIAAGKVTEAPAAMRRAYLDAVKELACRPAEGDRSVPIVYTPLHGVGDSLAHAALEEAGFTRVTSVPEQQMPDAAFPTVRFPNPEEPGAMDRALALADRTGADLVLANDPDADRLAVAVRHGGVMRVLTGNQVGVLLAHYLATATATRGGARRAVVTSIVSTPQLDRMAGDLGLRCEKTLTGFKWIANRAIELEREGFDVLLGFEEALGYCVGRAVRDKDGISAATVVAEMVAVLRPSGRTLVDALADIARRWGAYASVQLSVVRTGATGALAIARMMDELRARSPRRIGDDDVVAVADYADGTRTKRGPAGGGGGGDSGGGETPSVARLELPKSNVLAFDLASGGRVVARPSGTEPKMKLYFDACVDMRSGETFDAGEARARAAVRALQVAVGAMLGV